MAHHAKKGGEIGANGEFYKGGQFVADSEHTVKGKKKKTISGTRKIRIEPYKWVEAKTDEISIADRIQVALWKNWKNGLILDPNAEEICQRCHWNFELQKELIRRFNAGERIISKEEYDRISGHKF